MYRTLSETLIKFSRSIILALRTEPGTKYSVAAMESQFVAICYSGLLGVAEVACHILLTEQLPN